jgi:hypothetical protein
MEIGCHVSEEMATALPPRELEDIFFMEITPEGGRLKTDAYLQIGCPE